MSRRRMTRWRAFAIVEYNQPSFAMSAHEDPIEAHELDDFVDRMVESGEEAHEWCAERGWRYPPAEFWPK